MTDKNNDGKQWKWHGGFTCQDCGGHCPPDMAHSCPTIVELTASDKAQLDRIEEKLDRLLAAKESQNLKYGVQLC